MDKRLTQQERLLKELWKGKVNSYSATYSFRIKQAPTRIRELKDKGFNIVSIRKTDGSVDWELQSSPKAIVEPKVPMKEVVVKEDGYEYLKLVPDVPIQEVIFP